MHIQCILHNYTYMHEKNMLHCSIQAYVLSLNKIQNGVRKEGWQEGREGIKNPKSNLWKNSKQIMLYLCMKYQISMKMDKLALYVNMDELHSNIGYKKANCTRKYATIFNGVYNDPIYIKF